MDSIGKALIIWSSFIGLSSCANGICHPIKHPELAAAAGARTAANTNMCAAAATASYGVNGAGANCPPSQQTSTAGDLSGQSQMGTNPTGSFGPGVTNNSTNSNTLGGNRVAGLNAPKTIFIYKPDGSLQCNMGQSVSIEEMEKQLSGIPIVSRKRQPDGKMHMQVCGSATGFLNVYEIPETSLAVAVARGFKKL